MGDLLKAGPFRAGLLVVVLGIVVFIIIPLVPPADVPGGTALNATLLGQIGGAMIGVGLAGMVIGLMRRGR